jgi:hypothetical protein|nr:MAG TPA: hypothetical protein [Caudoviricetes sp.]
MRLIDADKLKEAINSSLNTGRETFSPEIIYEAVDEQPTVFDVDKVVEQLKTKKTRTAALQKKYTSEYFEGETDAFEFAIKIVKGGGAA